MLSRARVALLSCAVVLGAAACRPDYERAEPKELPSLPPPQPSASAAGAEVEEPPADAGVRPLRFEDVERSLAGCDRPATVPTKELLGASVVCRQKALAEAIDAATAPMDEARRARVRRIEPELSRFLDAACALNEATFSADLDAGTRDETPHGAFPFLSCKGGGLLEHVFFARLLAADDAGTFASWVDDAASRGAFVRARVVKMRAQLEGLHARDTDAGLSEDAGAWDAGADAGARRLAPWEVSRLATRAAFAANAPPVLAQMTCAAWPALGAALGGEAKCREKVVLYYFSYVPYAHAY